MHIPYFKLYHIHGIKPYTEVYDTFGDYSRIRNESSFNNIKKHISIQFKQQPFIKNALLSTFLDMLFHQKLRVHKTVGYIVSQFCSIHNLSFLLFYLCHMT